jgi:F0F1-type ATP synthase assembly protein I
LLVRHYDCFMNENGEDQERAKQEASSKRGAMVEIARYSQLAIALPAATVAGWFVGSLLDRWLHTDWIYIVGLVLGGAGGLVELVRLAGKDAK